MSETLEVIHPRCAGFDVHKETVAVCMRLVEEGGRLRTVVHTYRTETRDLSRLVAWLTSERVTHVAMESTGIYWKPIYNILEEQGKFDEILLCNAQHVRNVPGRKTDVKDCEWLARLLQHGLLKGSFVPPKHVREMRDLTRHRAKLTDQQTAVANRIHKVLQDANVKLSSVASDILGASGRDMIDAIIRGESDPAKLADLARRRLRGKIPDLELALDGRISEHHRFQLEMLMEHVRYLEQLIHKLDVRIAEVMNGGPDRGPPDPPQGAGPLFADVPDLDAPVENATDEPPPLPFDEAVQLLITVPGIKQRTAENVLVEIGTDMKQFPTAKHLASWAGLCPGNDQSAGKRRSGKTRKGSKWLRATLTEAANAAARTKGSYLQAQYHRLYPRRGHGKAITAVSHSILTIAWHMLTTGELYRDLGGDYFTRQNPDRLTKRLIQQLEALGHQVTLAPKQHPEEITA